MKADTGRASKLFNLMSWVDEMGGVQAAGFALGPPLNAAGLDIDGVNIERGLRGVQGEAEVAAVFVPLQVDGMPAGILGAETSLPVRVFNKCRTPTPSR